MRNFRVVTHNMAAVHNTSRDRVHPTCEAATVGGIVSGAAMSPLSTSAVFAGAYVTVLAAELIGDKTLYTLGSLASRHRVAPVVLGAITAFAAKMSVAVAAGRLVRELPPRAVALVSALTFFATALVLWRKPATVSIAPRESTHWTRPAAVAFGAVFFTEWADPGQLAAAAMVARHGAPFTVWAAATLAMVTKGLFGALLGVGLRRWLPRETARRVAVGVCALMGLVALVGVVA